MWPEASKHCPLCGASLVQGVVEGRPRRRCNACEFVLYLNPASAAAGVVVDPSRRILLVRRGIQPYRGDWALPAGYQEYDEDPVDTVRREVREEAGIEVRVLRLLDLVFVPRDYRKPANLAVYLCEAAGGALRPGSDALDAAWFPLDELPANLGFDNRRLLLERLVLFDGSDPDPPTSSKGALD